MKESLHEIITQVYSYRGVKDVRFSRSSNGLKVNVELSGESVPYFLIPDGDFLVLNDLSVFPGEQKEDKMFKTILETSETAAKKAGFKGLQVMSVDGWDAYLLRNMGYSPVGKYGWTREL